MSARDTNSLNPNGNGNGKDKHFEDQFSKVYFGFFESPQSMKMLSEKLKIDRANICWFCRDLRNNNQLEIAKKGICTITKRIVNFYTTNPKYFRQNNQLKMF